MLLYFKMCFKKINYNINIKNNIYKLVKDYRNILIS